MPVAPDLWAILNPEAGRVAREGRVIAELARLAGAEFHRTGAPGDATVLAARAAARGCRRLAVAGGDGTVQEVVNGLPVSGGGPALGLLPLGTGNDLCRGLGIPLDAGRALALLRTGRTRSLDLIDASVAGEARRLANFALGGFAGEVPRHVTERRRRQWGKLVYLRATLAALREVRAYRTRIVVDGHALREEKLLAVVVANGPVLGGGIPAAPPADPSDGRLDLVAVRALPAWRVPLLLARVLAGRHLDGRSAFHLRARSVTVDADPPMAFNGDGQPLGRGPARFRVLPGAVRYLAPGPRATGPGHLLSKGRLRGTEPAGRRSVASRSPEPSGGG